MAVTSYRQLAVWSKAMAVARSVYELADRMPKKEEYRLTSQIIRAAISVPANIAEGHARNTRKDYAHFISIARGSVAELETLLMLGRRLRFCQRIKRVQFWPRRRRWAVCSIRCT